VFLKKDKIEVKMQREVLKLKIDISKLHGVVEKMKMLEPYYSYYQLQEYENLKVENITRNLRKQALGVKAREFA
jgi:hypothetical protein